MELESLQRKKSQIDWIAHEMVQHWHLEKTDGTFMSARAEDCKVTTWSGSSTWDEERWVRDETKPCTNEYYVKTVTWRPNREIKTRPHPKDLYVPDSFPVLRSRRAFVPVYEIEQAGIPADLSAAETLRLLEEWGGPDPSDEDNASDHSDMVELDGVEGEGEDVEEE
jgi:hypothetical protein